jgi:lysophospholipid acyltransferase (LPLAT)-like uncharacterized protein
MSLIARSKAILTQLAGGGIAFAYHLWSGSWKVDKTELARLTALLDQGEGVILVFWHGKFLPLFALLAGSDAVVFTSACFRGRVIARISRHFGYMPSLIPPDGRGNTYRHMLGEMKRARLTAFATDGPLGPNHQAKPGAIKMASELGYVIVPVSVTCDRKVVMKMRWDKREWPRWGASVTLRVAEPIHIPKSLRREAVGDWTEIVTQAIDAAERPG